MLKKTSERRALSPISKVRYLVISDVHLGNTRNPASRILLNLYKFFGDFKDDSQFTKLDILFIDGDFFDKALSFSSEDVNKIIAFILALFAFCEKHKIALRYVEGTPSHDKQQFKNFDSIAKKFPNLDYRYIEEICVEAFYDLGITCLYVPDPHVNAGPKTEALIDNLLNDLGLEKVSIAIVHSWYKYQVPDVASETKFDEKFFLDRVVYYISNGHIHMPSTYSRIVNQGSFDRIAHGEEHDKGGVLFEIKEDESYFFFIKNENALPFRTVHLKTKDIDESLKLIDKIAINLVDGSWLRIKAKETHPVLASLEHLAQRYPHVRFEKITEEEEARKTQQLVNQAAFDTVDYVAPNLNRNTIVQATIDEMIARGKANHDMEALRIELENYV